MCSHHLTESSVDEFLFEIIDLAHSEYNRPHRSYDFAELVTSHPQTAGPEQPSEVPR